MLKCYMLRWLSCRRKFNKRWENKPQKASISCGMYCYYQYYQQGSITGGGSISSANNTC